MNDKINIFEVNAIRYFIIRASFISICLGSLLKIAKQDSYLSVLIGFGLSLLPIALYYVLINIDKSEDIISLLNNRLGNFIGKLLSLILIGLISLYASKIFSYLIQVVQYHYLDNINIILIGFIFLIPIIYLVSKNLNGIGKTSVILLFVSLLSFIFSLVFAVPKIDIGNFRPFTDNWNNILEGSFMVLNAFIPIFMLGIIPKNKIEHSDYLHKSFLFYLFDFLIILLIVFLIMGLNDINYILSFKFPVFQMFNSISIQGTQQILCLQWILDSFIFLVFSIYTICAILTISFNIPLKNSNVIISILLLALSLII